MSACPDWTALVRDRDRDAAGEAAWEAALAHLDGGCRRCAGEAHAADPTLMFRRLPAPAADAADVAAMREAVASLRRAGRVAALPSAASLPVFGRGTALTRRRPRAGGWRHLAAACVLAAAAAGLWIAAPEERPAVDPAALAAAPQGTAVPGASPFFAPGLAGPLAPTLAADPAGVEPAVADPAVVELSQPRAADVYEMGGGDLTLVMVVDETLDV